MMITGVAAPADPIGRRVVCAAVRNRYGSIICAPRHYDSIMRKAIFLAIEDGREWGFSEQGFVDQRGVFMSRETAREVAASAGQILRKCGGDDTKLFSENLY